MPLPPAGNSISISQIRAELSNSSGSLRTLSSIAGKSTPDSMSEFFGYSAGYYYTMEIFNASNCTSTGQFTTGYSPTALTLNYFYTAGNYSTLSGFRYQRQAQVSPGVYDASSLIDFTSTTATASCVSTAPVSYTHSIVAYNGFVTVSGTYTTKAGVANTSFSFYNSSSSGGVVGSICAREGTVNVTSGNGTKTQGSVC